MSDPTLTTGALAPSTSTSSALTVHGDALQVFSGIAAFDAAQRMAKALCSSTLVPKEYQGQQGLANSLIALEIAGRMRLSPLVVMQNMTPIHGRPTWSSKFLIATVNASGRFSPLRFVFDDKEQPTRCHAVATDKATGEVLEGETITLELARKEGWWSRKDRQGNETSKWQTMTGQMLRYRAAAWWANVYCPEIALGLMTQEEALDIEPVSVREAPAATLPTSSLDQPTSGATDAKQGPAVPALLHSREGGSPLPGPLNPEADAPLIRSEPAAGEAALPAAVVEAEIVDSGNNQPEPAPASKATPAATRRSRNQGTSAAGTTAANTPESPPSEQDPAPVGSQEPVEASPAPAATPDVDPVEAGLQQIPRIATLLELDAAYGRVNQLLGSGRITDSAAERLWSAVARRRKELEGETP
ncbi:MAG: hypothetical protein RLZZ54_672 [Cyanobacteriota bacterium]|jgi:hypothetical protein